YIGRLAHTPEAIKHNLVVRGRIRAAMGCFEHSPLEPHPNYVGRSAAAACNLASRSRGCHGATAHRAKGNGAHGNDRGVAHRDIKPRGTRWRAVVRIALRLTVVTPSGAAPRRAGDDLPTRPFSLPRRAEARDTVCSWGMPTPPLLLAAGLLLTPVGEAPGVAPAPTAESGD